MRSFCGTSQYYLCLLALKQHSPALTTTCIFYHHHLSFVIIPCFFGLFFVCCLKRARTYILRRSIKIGGRKSNSRVHPHNKQTYHSTSTSRRKNTSPRRHNPAVIETTCPFDIYQHHLLQCKIFGHATKTYNDDNIYDMCTITRNLSSIEASVF